MGEWCELKALAWHMFAPKWVTKWCRNLIGSWCKSTTCHSSFTSLLSMLQFCPTRHDGMSLGMVTFRASAWLKFVWKGRAKSRCHQLLESKFRGEFVFFFLNFKIPLNGSEFFLSKIFQRVFQIPGVLASDSTGHHPAPACELSFLKDRSISPGIPCLQPGDVVLFKRMKFAKHWSMAASQIKQ